MIIGRTGLQRGFKTAMDLARRSSTLAGKVAIVTASTEGIGYAIARRLGQDGAKVVVSSRKQSNVDRTVKQLQSEGLQVSGLVCHVGKDDDRKKLISKALEDYGKIDILVSNAATNPVYGPIMDVTEAAWDKIFDVNVKSTFLLLKEAVPHMAKQTSGAITIVSSIVGLSPFQGLGAYSVSKTALLGLTKTLANELAPSGIRVNCIAPGIIKTKFSQALLASETARDMALQYIPLHRFGTPDDCAGTVSFLSSDDASYITGETIVIAGGTTSRL